MWDVLKQVANQALERGSAWFRHVGLINELFQLPENEAIARLRVAVRGMGAQEFVLFDETLDSLISQAQAALEQAQQNRNSEWGDSSEDRMARMMAGIQGGEGPSREMKEAQGRVQSLLAVAAYAKQFRDEMDATPQPEIQLPASVPPATQHQAAPDAMQAREAIQAIEVMVTSGTIPDNLAEIVQRFQHLAPDQMQTVIGKLHEIGADQGASPPLNIRDYYRPGDGRFQPLWPLGLTLPIAFDELDRETQFHVLWREWSRRECEGLMLLQQGDVGGARLALEECLGRACQLEVGELVARAYEGLMRVAQRNGDRSEERRYLEASQAARN